MQPATWRQNLGKSIVSRRRMIHKTVNVIQGNENFPGCRTYEPNPPFSRPVFAFAVRIQWYYHLFPYFYKQGYPLILPLRSLTS